MVSRRVLRLSSITLLLIPTHSSTPGLYWTNLTVSTGNTVLLQPFDGVVPNGHVCGILGPSGAGKSTTLRALTKTSNVGLWNGTMMENIDRKHIAWLAQDDAFFDMLTVQETLELAAYLESDRDYLATLRVESTLQALGLARVAHSRTVTLSGGEKRRLSLALELVSNQAKLFVADEPTSGLDSTLSEKVIRLIRSIVRQQSVPALLSIHQPRSSIWRMLDSVILIAPGGRVCYMGRRDQVIDYMKNLGFECPAETNPAEFLLDLVSMDSEDAIQRVKDEARVQNLFEAFQRHQTVTTTSWQLPKMAYQESQIALTTETSSISHRIGRFGRLIRRSWRQNVRNAHVNVLRLLASGGNAFLCAQIFKSVVKGLFTAKSVADRTALLSFGVINMACLAVIKTLDLFAREKPVVSREQKRDLYSGVEYLLSKSIAEIPLDSVFAGMFVTVLKLSSGISTSWGDLTGIFSMLTVAGASLGFAVGAWTRDRDAAISIGVPLLSVLMAVGVINPSGIDPTHPPPFVARKIAQVSPIAYAIRGVCVTEYRGRQFDNPRKGGWWARSKGTLADLPKMGALALVRNGDQVLDELGLAEETYGGTMKQLGYLAATNLLISWIGLRVKQGQSDDVS